MSLAGDLSAFALSPLPPSADPARRIMQLSLFDWMICGLAGADEPVARILRATAPGGGTCSVFGETARFPPASAAWINGATSHALDYDDTHFAHIGHPSVAVFPAALAVARDGAEALDAALIGAEISVRIGLWLGRAHYQTGFHQTATAGAFGATATAGRVLGLNAGQMQAALGAAATQAAGLKSQFGTMGKPYHAGLAARTGVEAATLTAAGFDTRGAGLDGPQGFGPTHHGEGDLTAFDGLGTTWLMEAVSHKFHACCHGLHAMLEALAALDLDPSSVQAVEVRTHPRWLSVCNIAEPSTGLECKFSFRHTAAMTLLGWSTAALHSYTDAAATDRALTEMRDRVRVVPDERIAETASRVLVQTRSGPASATHDLAAPFALENRITRLRAKGRALVGEAREAQFWDAVHAGCGPDLAAISALMTADHPLSASSSSRSA